MEIYTIGFTQKTALEFFDALKQAGIRRVVDVRLNNRSQLAAFAKRDDLCYFLEVICGAAYAHETVLSPTKDMLDGFKAERIAWEEYEERFRALLEERRVEEILDQEHFEAPTALLCSEPGPEHCHRRLAAEYLAEHWGGTITHL